MPLGPASLARPTIESFRRAYYETEIVQLSVLYDKIKLPLRKSPPFSLKF